MVNADLCLVIVQTADDGVQYIGNFLDFALALYGQGFAHVAGSDVIRHAREFGQGAGQFARIACDNQTANQQQEQGDAGNGAERWQ